MPMANQEATISERYEKAYDEVKEKYNCEIVSPINIEAFKDKNYKRDHDWAWYMGRDIEMLLRCDSIYLTRGWMNSRGCRAEYAIAKELNLNIIYSDDHDLNL